MLEALVSSRTRRALFEHIITHPTERFYLRGLAKALSLSVSPLRRELKRLERSGLLRAVHEGNMLFYQVEPSSPAFLQLRQATLPVPRARAVQPPHQPDAEAEAPSAVVAVETAPVSAGLANGGVAGAARPAWHRPLSVPALIGATGLGMALMLLVIGLAYLNLTNRRLVSQVSRTLATRAAEVTVVVPERSASGVMRGSRWQIVPGGFGGFSPAASQPQGETY